MGNIFVHQDNPAENKTEKDKIQMRYFENYIPDGTADTLSLSSLSASSDF